MKIFLLTSLLVLLVTEAASHWGRCPDHQPQQAFNINNFLGKWSEISRSRDDRVESGDCLEIRFDLTRENQIKVIISQSIAGQIDEIEGQAYCDSDKPSQCYIKYFKFQPWKDYKIIYSSSSNLLIYSCSSYYFRYSDQFWLYSKEKHSYDKSLLEKIKQLGFNAEDIRMTNQSDC